MGYFNQSQISLDDQKTKIELILLSRRNRYRSGVRMHCRGIDEQGNVANYVETEQVNRSFCFSSDH